MATVSPTIALALFAVAVITGFGSGIVFTLLLCQAPFASVTARR